MLGDQAHPKQRLTGREINFERIAHRLRETRRQLARLVTSLVSLLSPAVPVACDTLLHSSSLGQRLAISYAVRDGDVWTTDQIPGPSQKVPIEGISRGG
jgi:hypothetical protein